MVDQFHMFYILSQVYFYGILSLFRPKIKVVIKK